MIVNEIMEILENLAPVSYAERWDNSGLLVGRGTHEADCIYIALDATETVIKSAIDCGAKMLITHHPMIFTPIKSINDKDFIGRRILKLIENGISYYAMHTNFDVAKMAELAADRLNLTHREILEVTIDGWLKDGKNMGIGCCGSMPEEMTLSACAQYVKQAFDISSVKIFGDIDKKLSRVAVCPGSGKHMTKYAIDKGCDVLITGDIDHHEGIDAVSQGISIIDAGHHGIEHIFVEFTAQYLAERLDGVRIEFEPNQPPFTVI